MSARRLQGDGGQVAGKSVGFTRPAAMDFGRYERFAKFLQDKGLVKAMPPVASYAVELP